MGEHSPQRVCEFGGALYDKVLFHESTSIEILTQERPGNTQKCIQSNTGDRRRSQEALEEAEPPVASHLHRGAKDSQTWLLGTWAKSPKTFLHQADSFPVSSFKRRAPARGPEGKSMGQSHGLQPRPGPLACILASSGLAEKITNLHNSGNLPSGYYKLAQSFCKNSDGFE